MVWGFNELIYEGWIKVWKIALEKMRSRKELIEAYKNISAYWKGSTTVGKVI